MTWETYAEEPRPPVLEPLARTTREGGGTLNPDAGELEITAGWGNAGKGGITMPGKGNVVERGYTEEEQTAMGSAIGQLGETTLDVYLNDVAYWKNIPSRVWEYALGGYQVIKNWLRYRERELLCSSLTAEEARYVQEMTHRIAAILLMEPALDANYEAVKRNAYPWAGDSSSSVPS